MARQIIRLTEQDLHRMIMEAVEQVLSEDGFDGAANANISAAATYDMPIGGGVVRRKGYNQDKVSKGMTEVDPSDALARHDGVDGSIGIPKQRVGGKKK